MKAVVIFNLGGPDSLDAVQPFLFNLFYDRAIINLPNPIRFMLAQLVSRRRKKTADDIYSYLGGKSPILEETEAQSRALQDRLGNDYKVFVAMRYWHPSIESVVEDVIDSKPDEVILLPLYPQFSTTTTGSFIGAWKEALSRKKSTIPTRIICCYPNQEHYISALVDSLQEASVPSGTRFLFSAHGLPQKCIDAGDPYEAHVHLTVQAVLNKMPEITDSIICYQSKVGPLKWLGPSTEDELQRAAKDQVPVAIVPISFVSENSETLYELDYQYKMMMHGTSLPGYMRVPTIGCNSNYIDALVDLVTNRCNKSCNFSNCRLVANFRKVA